MARSPRGSLLGHGGAGMWHFKFIWDFGGLIWGAGGLIVRLGVSVSEYCTGECECICE